MTPTTSITITPKASLSPATPSRFTPTPPSPNAPREYFATIKAGTARGPQSQMGAQLKYDPAQRELKIRDIWPEKIKGAEIPGGAMLHTTSAKQAAGEMLQPSHVKELLGKAAKMFPKADVLYGERITGAKAAARDKALEAGKLTEMPDMTQEFNLKGIRKRLGRLGKAGKALGIAGLALSAGQSLRTLLSDDDGS